VVVTQPARTRRRAARPPRALAAGYHRHAVDARVTRQRPDPGAALRRREAADPGTAPACLRALAAEGGHMAIAVAPAHGCRRSRARRSGTRATRRAWARCVT